MAAALKLDPSIIGNIVQGTTRWLLADPNSSMERIAEAVSPKLPIVCINMDYSESPYEGLQATNGGTSRKASDAAGPAWQPSPRAPGP
jgi:hypothetical protein